MLTQLILPILALGLVSGAQLAKLDSFTQTNPNTYTMKSGPTFVQLSILDERVFRLQAIPSGDEFVEPSVPIVVKDTGYVVPESTFRDTYDAYEITIKNYRLKIHKNPMHLTLFDEYKQVFHESKPIEFNGKQAVQFFESHDDEFFFGGGMQNGRFQHKNTNINITVNYNWDDGGNPNPSPFYLSSKGYGVFRNTFAAGNYNFTSPIQLVHQENRFDAYYFLGNAKTVLNKYTALTGRPFMPPIYGLELGDSDCYLKTANGRPPKDTLIDSTKVAQGYVDNDMPIGWLLVNDGYGCGYTRLGETNEALAQRNASLGLWTESNLTNQPTEVGKWGVRVRKLDVAWVGDGYEFGFKACNEAYNGIQDNSDARGFVWLVEGWAGSQKCAVQWTGDQSGNWENIRFHIPTLHGSGNSAQVYVAGDVDGIFRGSANTYIRDLQYKVFTPVLMTMSGWAAKDKQPWRYGEPGTSINRKYLKLRERLLPYIYTLANEAHRTGVPIVRSHMLEYPEDSRSYDKETTKYQYFFGPSFLVAPVYKNELKRDNIYIPQGAFIDYWTGKVYRGQQTLNNYPAPLDIIPLFVKANSIIPMWGEINSFRNRKPSDRIYLDIFTAPGVYGNNHFSLYEDDLVTRQFQKKEFSTQLFNLTTTPTSISFRIGNIVGSYKGKPNTRPYTLNIKTNSRPADLQIKGLSKDLYTWNYDDKLRAGTATVEVSNLAGDQELDIELQL